MSLKKKAFQGFIWTGIENFGTVGISFIVQIFLARLISPEEFGLLGLIVIFNAIGVTITESGLSQSVIRLQKPTEDDYFILFVFNSFISIFIYFIIFFSAPYISNFYNIPILESLIKVYALIIPILALNIVQRTKLTKDLNFKLQATIQIPSIIISSIIGLTLGYLNYGVWALIVMQLSQAILLTIQFWVRSGYVPNGRLIKKKVLFHLDFGYKLLFSGLINTIYSNIYPAVIGKFNSTTEVGYFSRASTFKNVPISIISSVFGKVTYPLLAEIQNEPKRLVETYRRLLRIMLLVVTPIMCILFLIAEPLIILLITDKWLPMAPYFKWLCMSGILFPMHSYYLNAIKIKGRSDLFLRAEIIKKILGGTILFISASMGIMAIIYGILISSILGLFVNQYYCRKVMDYSLFNQNLDGIRIIFPSLIVMIFTLFIKNKIYFNINNIFEIILSVSTFLTLYMISQYIVNRNSINEFKFLTQMIKK
ncbi:lipopolysaccharide biosynthesis protein [Weeksellaceae bacterium KMM 9724]|uniref:lipopolysaccharide biosynthesis protein n=1 Tax=Profundicola chukchiensis TaxID=2961959 RepID=UPI00243D79EB|nr:lipopolysaccharide biosynthesis protein [Profundicola chukchiensis]MDG4949875.1 lipopolysaccharide biosynthesis protein [Profundicola chukchiensis]